MQDKNIENRGWEQMQQLLDKEMPQEERKRRPFVWLWWGAALLFAIIACFLFNQRPELEPTIASNDSVILSKAIDPIAKQTYENKALTMDSSELQKSMSLGAVNHQSRDHNVSSEDNAISEKVKAEPLTSMSNTYEFSTSTSAEEYDTQSSFEVNATGADNYTYAQQQEEQEDANSIEKDAPVFKYGEEISEIIETTEDAGEKIKEYRDHVDTYMMSSIWMPSPQIEYLRASIKVPRSNAGGLIQYNQRQKILPLGIYVSAKMSDHDLAYGFGTGITMDYVLSKRWLSSTALGYNYYRFDPAAESQDVDIDNTDLGNAPSGVGNSFANAGLQTEDILTREHTVSAETLIKYRLFNKLYIGTGVGYERVLNSYNISATVNADDLVVAMPEELEVKQDFFQSNGLISKNRFYTPLSLHYQWNKRLSTSIRAEWHHTNPVKTSETRLMYYSARIGYKLF